MGKIDKIGIKTIQQCKYCRGVGRLRAVMGSKDWIRGKRVGAVGLSTRQRGVKRNA